MTAPEDGPRAFARRIEGESAGTAAGMSEIMMDGIVGDLKRLESALDSFIRKFFESGAADVVSDLAQAAAHSQPFAMEYAMLSQVWPNRRQLDALTAPARTGALTLDDLADSFPAQSVREALGQTQRLWGVIEVRRTGDDQGVADQILGLIEQGALNEAIALAEGLDAEADTTLEPWLIEARKREALDATLEDMRDTLARQADVNEER